MSTTKRPFDQEEDSEDDYGPKPSTETPTEDLKTTKIAKKTKKLDFESLFLQNLPSADFYERSYMHRDTVTHIVVSKPTEFIITGSIDGHVKFWKKMPTDIEFVKHFQAHLGPIHAMSLSPDGNKLVTTSSDQMIKFFEVVGFDMSNMLSVEYIPTAATWLNGQLGLFLRVAVADQSCGKIRIYRSDGDSSPLAILTLHNSPVKTLALNLPFNTIISADSKGIIEYWSASPDSSSSSEEDFDRSTSLSSTSPSSSTSSSTSPSSSPSDAGYHFPTDRVSFRFKTETDLYDLAKCKALPCQLSVHPQGTSFSLTSDDKSIRIFDFQSGKLKKKLDERSSLYTPSPTSSSSSSTSSSSSSSSPTSSLSGAGAGLGLDAIEMGRRQAMERELEASSSPLSLWAAPFDETGHFLLFGSLVGIKIFNLTTNKVSRVIGVGESGERFLSLALYQGVPKVDSQYLLARAGQKSAAGGGGGGGGGGKGGSGELLAEQLQKEPQADPTLFVTSFKRRRFYCFSTREPDESGGGSGTGEGEGRDVLNEKPTAEEVSSLPDLSMTGKKSRIGSEAILHTSMGDIHVKMFGNECPKTVENFTVHSRGGYYDNLIFHRVIKGFMIQTGDPLGDGTGGESIWGGEFEDELVRTLKHDRPFTLSMANAGPNTNGSQFFITTVPTPWLDGKHTVFGRVTKGFEVVTAIENVKVNNYDKPYTEIKLLNIDIL